MNARCFLLGRGPWLLGRLAPLLLASVFAFFYIQNALAENNLTLIKVKGNVNTTEIGGSGLYVFSIWDKDKNSFVAADGGFTTVISDSRPQKLAVKDAQKKTRALSIIIPKDSEKIIFDAKSTAQAILFREPRLLATSASVETTFLSMAKSKSFWDLTGFLKKKLPGSSLEGLMDNPEFISLIDRCNAEVFGENTQDVTKSLYAAKERLERLLQER